jgi:hypothetical protein
LLELAKFTVTELEQFEHKMVIHNELVNFIESENACDACTSGVVKTD